MLLLVPGHHIVIGQLAPKYIQGAANGDVDTAAPGYPHALKVCLCVGKDGRRWTGGKGTSSTLRRGELGGEAKCIAVLWRPSHIIALLPELMK